MAVSYTHLDVYKRQLLWFEKILRFQQFEILILVRGIIEIVCGVLRMRCV